ncbi:hypothetical protein [Microcoleus sp. B4-C5]|uniref:hypothetical protein n=1 Tax=Microcoleus sp. B4-C5 TaxID=2818664 RepID=UPI002FD4DD2B
MLNSRVDPYYFASSPTARINEFRKPVRFPAQQRTIKCLYSNPIHRLKYQQALKIQVYDGTGVKMRPAQGGRLWFLLVLPAVLQISAL